MNKKTENPSVGVIISTYNNPKWLEKTLWGYECQSIPSFELIVADDGSTDETKTLLEDFRMKSFPNLKHIWHPDEGFQKCKILNRALSIAESDYLIFTDQDCIPRYDFIETHLLYSEENFFLSGGYFKLPLELSEQISRQDILFKNAFDLSWLRKRGLKNNFKSTKLIQNNAFCAFMNKITPTKASWNGCNSSGWRKDFFAINGFDTRMKYGGEDREFGERLFNKGVKSKQIRYSAICLHLDHSRPYKNEEVLLINKEIRKETQRKKIISTEFGII